jgi:hypothetical protein
MARYNESEVTPFKDLLYEMPQLNDITKHTTGYSVTDKDDAHYSNKQFKRRYLSNLPSGHRLYYISHPQLDSHYFAAYHPTENKIETMIHARKTNNTTFQESSLRKREGSPVRVDDMMHHLINHHGYTIYSDYSHSDGAKRVWTRLRDKLRQSGGKMHHIDINDHETFAEKPMNSYYGDTPSVFKASPSPNVAERLKKRLGRGKSRTE